MTVQIYHVDAFHGTAGRGNPGAVCILDEAAPDDWMQAVAAQMNLSETGFVHLLPSGDFSLRWFSPLQEMALCGHVTLAAAHVLWREAKLSDEEVIRFQTASGRLEATRSPSGIEIDLPANRCQAIEEPAWLRCSLSIEPRCVLGGERKYLVELPTEADVLQVEPDFGKLRVHADRGVIVTALSDDPHYDFISRYFAGYVGVDEDPVTGSAHCCLIPYWRDKLGKDVLRARQASKRGGELCGRIEGDRVFLKGNARTVMSGTLFGALLM
jgi:PhzF family phenazine biosynthesis protein